MAMPQWLKSRSVLLVVILAAVLLEVISTIQYSYTRGIMEQELERRAYSELVVSVLNIEEVLAVAEVTAQSQRWHAERNLDNPDYMNLLVNNIVRADSEIIVGAGIGFKPDYYPEKGRLFEPYAHQVSSSADSIILEQIGARHDYTKVVPIRQPSMATQPNGLYLIWKRADWPISSQPIPYPFTIKTIILLRCWVSRFR